MSPILEQLTKQEVINKNQIIDVKRSIANLHPTYTSSEKTELLKKEVFVLIERSLPHYCMDTKRMIRAELLKLHSFAGSLSITARDIVESSLQVASSKEVIEELPIWIIDKVDEEIDVIQEYVETILEIRENFEKEWKALENDRTSKGKNYFVLQSEDILYRRFSVKNLYAFAAMIYLLFLPIILRGIEFPFQQKDENPEFVLIREIVIQTNDRLPNALPFHLQYESINKVELKAWLDNRNSMLSTDPYFSSMIKVADEFNIHPFLLFAITGQEQGFVPKSHKKAKEMANNPFNVFHSWEEFSTNITDSSQIAARTIINLSKDRPEGVHPIKWINRKYAEDSNWWVGVNSIFEQLEREVK